MGKVKLSFSTLDFGILYLIAVLAGLVNVWVGVTAFVCMTALIITMIRLAQTGKDEEKKE